MKLKFNYAVLAATHAFAALALVGCGGGSSSVDDATSDASVAEQAERIRWRKVDSTLPTVAITSTSSVDSAGKVTLTGMAADNMNLYKVRW